jgi:cobalt-zinc-cadmium efflux system protein
MSESHQQNDQQQVAVQGRPLVLAIVLNVFITVAQIIGGLISGSLALIGDALHNFSDVLSLVISYIANKLRSRQSSFKHTFGYKRAQILAAFINALTLIGVSIYLIFEAVQRLFVAQEVLSTYVIILAIAGILVNGGSVYLLVHLQKGDSNLRAAYLHLLGDLATSFAVLIGGIAMWLYNEIWIDSAITILVGIYLIYTAGKLFVHSVNVLMHFVPGEVDLPTVYNSLCEIEGIHSLHHVHVWRLDDDAIHFEGHVRLSEDMTITEFESVKDQVKEKLRTEFSINHCIVQPEFALGVETEPIIKED